MIAAGHAVLACGVDAVATTMKQEPATQQRINNAMQGDSTIHSIESNPLNLFMGRMSNFSNTFGER